MHIVALTGHEAPLLAAIHAQSVEEAWSLDAFSTLLQTPCYGGWLAVIEDQPVGFLLVSQLAPEAEILTFAVRPEWRRQQIGTQLLQHFLATSKDQITTVFLEVDCENQAAIELYQAFDFKRIATRPAYYHHFQKAPTDAWVMQLII